MFCKFKTCYFYTQKLTDKNSWQVKFYNYFLKNKLTVFILKILTTEYLFY